MKAEKLHHVHPNENIKFYFFTNEKLFNFKDLEYKIGELLWENSELNYVIHRIKGIIHIKEDDYMYIL